MPLHMKMSQNINETTRHFVIFRFLQIFYGLTTNQLKKIKRTKNRLKTNIKTL